MEISVLIGKLDAETAVGPAVGNSSSRVGYWRFIREGRGRGKVGRLVDRWGSGKTTGEDLKGEGGMGEAGEPGEGSGIWDAWALKKYLLDIRLSIGVLEG